MSDYPGAGYNPQMQPQQQPQQAHQVFYAQPVYAAAPGPYPQAQFVAQPADPNQLYHTGGMGGQPGYYQQPQHQQPTRVVYVTQQPQPHRGQYYDGRRDGATEACGLAACLACLCCCCLPSPDW